MAQRTKPFDLQEWNSRRGPSPVLVKTHVWGKVWAICDGERNKLLAQKQMPGTFFKIVDAVTKKTVEETEKEKERARKKAKRQAKQLELKFK